MEENKELTQHQHDVIESIMISIKRYADAAIFPEGSLITSMMIRSRLDILDEVDPKNELGFGALEEEAKSVIEKSKKLLIKMLSITMEEEGKASKERKARILVEVANAIKLVYGDKAAGIASAIDNGLIPNVSINY